jgi:hypothetical protein
MRVSKNKRIERPTNATEYTNDKSPGSVAWLWMDVTTGDYLAIAYRGREQQPTWYHRCPNKAVADVLCRDFIMQSDRTDSAILGLLTI